MPEKPISIPFSTLVPGTIPSGIADKCALTIYEGKKKITNSIGKIEGYISPSIKGNNGFGYDPIFIPKGAKITFGEMKASQKYKIDHRFKAFKNIKKFF